MRSLIAIENGGRSTTTRRSWKSPYDYLNNNFHGYQASLCITGNITFEISAYLQHDDADPHPNTIFHAKLALSAGGLVKSKLHAIFVQIPESAKLLEYSTEAVLLSLNTPRMKVFLEIFRCNPTEYPIFLALSPLAAVS